MFLSRLRRKTQIRRRKGGRETLAEDAVRFQDIVVSKTQARGVAVPNKLLRELQRGSEQQDGGKRLYKLDLRRAHLTDAHVEALTEALQELPVVRKLDLRGNDALTAQALNALKSVLKGQVELFRLVQADPSLADSSLSFLYSVKLDAAVLSLERTATEQLEAQTAALEVADSVLDVRHAFFEADVRESGTLTEHELSDAMRTVMGATPKAAETSRVLRFFGEPGAEGREPTMINLGGFEAAMAGRLRESHTLPVLSQRRDDLLFGSAEDTGNQDTSECFSPWSTRSFGATTGGVRGGKGGGGGGGGNKRSPLSASQDLHSPAGMGTHVLPLPPWRGRESGSELEGTLKDNEQHRNLAADDDLENIFDDHNDNDPEQGDGNSAQETTPRRGGDIGRPVVGNGPENDNRGYDKGRRSRSSSDNKGAGGGRGRGATQDKEPRTHGPPAQQKGELSKTGSAACLERISARRDSLKDGGGKEDFVLTDGSSDDELSCSSPTPSKGGGLITRKGSRLRNEDPALSSEPDGNWSPADGSDCRRRSSGTTPSMRGGEENGNIVESGRGEKREYLSEDPAKGGRRASSTPQFSLSENQNAEIAAGTGSPTYRRHSILDESQNDDDAAGYSSPAEKTAPTGQPGLSTDIEPSASRRSSIVAMHQTTDARTGFPHGDDKDAMLAPPEKAKKAGALTWGDGGLDVGCLHGVPAKGTGAPGGGTREEETTDARGAAVRTAACVAAPEAAVGATPPMNVLVSASTAAAAPGEITQFDAAGAGKERQPGGEVDATPSSGIIRPPVGGREQFRPASTSSLVDLEGRRPSTAKTASCETAKRCVEEATAAAAVGPSSAVASESSVGGSMKARGGMLDLPVSQSRCEGPRSGGGQEAPASASHDITSNADGTATEYDQNGLTDKSAEAIRSPLEAITEVPGEESSGDSFNGDARSSAVPAAPTAVAVSTLDSEYRGGAMRKPYCLSPTNVARQARDSGATAAVGSSCRDRERLAARIQLSAGGNAAAAVAGGTGPQGSASGPLPLNSSTTGSCFDGAFTPDRGGRDDFGWTKGNGSPASYGDADDARWRSAGKTQASPERERRGCGWLEGDGAPVESERCSPPSPSSLFYLPSSETKTAPLCGAGGSTSLYEGSTTAINKLTASERGGGRAWCLSRVGNEAAIQGGGGGHTGTMGVIAGGEVKEGCGLSRLDEEQLALQLNEGALVISRSGLGKMGAVLELEAVYGRGRDSTIGLHTLVLSYNQLQVLDMSVLTTMPALRHLDISHNLLCRMEPMDGRDLPPRLETLNMSHNRITRIGGIGQCFLLRVVDLRHNRIKRVQGLEHLCLLEQLDLGHNLISKTASARALSFNRSLKLLWLEGNPLARHPRYRPTLTCLLPHVRAIDGRGMPPSSDSEQRRWAAGGGLVGEEDESSKLKSSGVTTRGKHPRGSSGNVGVSREWQAGQDERRSKEWRQVMEWRKEQAMREEEAKGLTSGARGGSRQAVNAAQQKRQAEELARPRPRTCPSEEAISKAKAMACHRPSVAFGISYRGEMQQDLSYGDDGCMPPASRTMANEPPPAPLSPGKQYHHLQMQQRQEDELFGASADSYRLRGEVDGGGAVREENDAVRLGDTLGCREMMSRERAPQDDRFLRQAHQGGSDAPASRLPSSTWSTVGGVDGGDDRTLPVPTMTSKQGEDEGLLMSNDGDSGARECVTEALEGRGGGPGAELTTIRRTHELVDSWLLDVRLETETAGTALRVLLRMCKEHGRHHDEKRRLSSFRTALEGMGLFSPQHGPMPTSFHGNEGHVLALKVKAAARQVAMTKAAVQNMLRLLESAESGEVGTAEIEQYAEFIQQQREIMVGGGEHPNAGKSSPTAKRLASTAGVAKQSKESESPAADTAAGQQPIATSENDGVAAVSPASSSLFAPAELPAGVSATPTTQRTPTVVLGASQPQQEVDTHSIQDVSQLLFNADASTSSGAIPSPRAVVAAAVDPALTPTEGTEKVLATGSDTTPSDLTDTDGKTVDNGTAVEPCGVPEATPSVDAQCLTPATRKKGELGSDSLDQGEESSRVTVLSASPCSVPLPIVTATATAPPAGEQLHSSSPQANGDAVRSDASGNGDDVCATAAVAVAIDVAPATGAPAGGELEEEVADQILSQLSPASPVVADTSAALSARERLLRHVRAATSPRSDASSCSSGSDDDEGGAPQPAAEAVQLGQSTKPAQEEDDGGECPGEGVVGIGGDHDPVTTAVDTKTRPGKAGNRPDGRPLTTRPVTRQKAGCDGGGVEGGGGGEETVASGDTRGECGVSPVPSITQLPNPPAPAEARDGIVVLLNEDESSVAPTIPGTVQAEELNIGVIPTETAGESSNDVAATATGGGKDGGGTDSGQSGDTRGKDEDGSIPSGRAACDGEIAHDAESNDGGDHVEASTLDAVKRSEKEGGEDTCDVAASASRALTRQDITIFEDGSEGDGSPQPAAGAVAENGPINPTTKSEPTAAGESNGNPSAVSNKAAKAGEETEEQEPTKPKAVGETDGDTTAIGPDDAAAAATEPDWIEGYDPGHDCYYYHHVPTGESRWYKPDEPYEPYVHSDEDQEDEEVALSSEKDDFQTTTAGLESERDDQRRERRRQKEKDRNVDRNYHQRERAGLDKEEEEVEATSTRSSSAHKGKKSSSKRRTSRSSKASAGESHRRSKYDDDDDDERYVSRSSSRDYRRGDGRRGSKESSSRKRGKTALERLNDLTDENSCASGDLRSDDRGDSSHRTAVSSRRHSSSRGSRRNSNNEHSHGSSRRSGSGRRAKARQGLATREKGYYDEDDGNQSPSTKSSRSILSSDGSNAGHKRENSILKRSGSGHGGSEYRRKGR